MTWYPPLRVIRALFPLQLTCHKFYIFRHLTSDGWGLWIPASPFEVVVVDPNDAAASETVEVKD